MGSNWEKGSRRIDTAIVDVENASAPTTWSK